MKLLRKFLILSHRYTGIVFSGLVVMWFATGITMMYVGGMPRLTPELRIDRLPPVDLARVRLSPAEAAGRTADGGPTRLLTIMDRPDSLRSTIRAALKLVLSPTTAHCPMPLPKSGAGSGSTGV